MLYVCIGHKTNCKSLYFLYLASYSILFLDKFQDAINKTNFCYVGKGKEWGIDNKTTKKSVAITFSFDYPQQKNLFKDFKEFGK